VIGGDPGWFPGVSEEITDAIHADLPELEGIQEMRLSA
jgi:hypothetical protein